MRQHYSRLLIRLVIVVLYYSLYDDQFNLHGVFFWIILLSNLYRQSYDNFRLQTEVAVYDILLPDIHFA